MTKLTRRSLLAGLAATASLGPLTTAKAAKALQSLIVMTEHYPPFNYSEGDKLRGISVDIMVEMFKRAQTGHQRADINMLPWARGYNLTLQRPGHALFSTTRTEDREKLFKWVGPFVPTVIGLTARKDRNLKLKSIYDLSKLRIGVVKDDVGQLLLRANGVPDDRIEVVLANEQNYRKLIAGRVDAISYETQVTKYGLQKLGADASDYEVVYELKRGDLYLALHRQTPDSVIEPLQQAFESLVADGRYQEIIDSYQRTT